MGALTHAAWADDTWLVDAAQASLKTMSQDSAQAADAGLGKCSIADVTHGAVRVADDEPAREASP